MDFVTRFRPVKHVREATFPDLKFTDVSWLDQRSRAYELKPLFMANHAFYERTPTSAHLHKRQRIHNSLIATIQTIGVSLD